MEEEEIPECDFGQKMTKEVDDDGKVTWVCYNCEYKKQMWQEEKDRVENIKKRYEENPNDPEAAAAMNKLIQSAKEREKLIAKLKKSMEKPIDFIFVPPFVRNFVENSQKAALKYQADRENAEKERAKSL